MTLSTQHKIPFHSVPVHIASINDHCNIYNWTHWTIDSKSSNRFKNKKWHGVERAAQSIKRFNLHMEAQKPILNLLEKCTGCYTVSLLFILITHSHPWAWHCDSHLLVSAACLRSHTGGFLFSVHHTHKKFTHTEREFSKTCWHKKVYWMGLSLNFIYCVIINSYCVHRIFACLQLTVISARRLQWLCLVRFLSKNNLDIKFLYLSQHVNSLHH